MKKDGLLPGVTPDRAEHRRRRIIEAARKLFVNKGFHATGVAQIARESGIAVGQLYRDFAAKEDIVAAIVEGDCTKFFARESLRRAIDAGDPDAVWVWLRGFIEPPNHDPGTVTMFAEIAAESMRNVRIASIFIDTSREADANLRAALAVLAPGEHVADRRSRLADLVFAQSLGLKQYRLFRPHLDTEPLVDGILRLVGREVERLQAMVPTES